MSGPNTLYLASWIQCFAHPFTGISGEDRLTQHVDERELIVLREKPSVLDLRSIEVSSLLAEPDADQLRWLHGGDGWPLDVHRNTQRDFYEKDLAVDLVHLARDLGSTEKRRMFAERLAMYALFTDWHQCGSPLEHAHRRVGAPMGLIAHRAEVV